jgi:GDP-L-fucose synthase
MHKDSLIYVAGHTGMVGSAIVRNLKTRGYSRFVESSSSVLDLRIQQDVNAFFANNKPEYVFLAAAKVGGIVANNTFRANYLYDNLLISANVIHAAFTHNVKKLLFLGSSCIYPKHADQPLRESYLLSGPLEPTNEPYAIAKIAGIKLCETYRYQYGCDFISAMPTNLYGTGDNYHPDHSHVIPGLIRKFCEAVEKNQEEVMVWGTGKVLREFLHADDAADACVFLMLNYSGDSFVNVGSGEDLSISDLAHRIAKLTGFKGKIVFDSAKPDGTPRKLMDVRKLKEMGWVSTISLEEGLSKAIREFREGYLTRNVGHG